MSIAEPADMLSPRTLRGEHVALIPLERTHAPALGEAVKDGASWKLWYTQVPSPEAMEAEIGRRLGLQAARSMLPFTVLDAAGEAVGMTTCMNIDEANRRLEIGSTWYAARVRRTALNTEAKLLLMTDAFERLGCIAVEFRTHWHNRPSRRAIERLGAKLDGVLRNHVRAANGTLRDTCVYSVTAAEWPAVKAGLEFALGR